ncbi:MAG: hypothetical protein NT023_24035 [Armatimonadetes bacterium]|nr:hypothetical protein [Armatimonadota bacterium]
MYTPFERDEAFGYRKDSVENRLREGSPVIGVSVEEGLYLLTVCRGQRKVYEIYDRQMFSAIGMQGDIEDVRVSVIQMAHQEGFERSPDDVTLQRLIGFALSRRLKQAFGDILSSSPFVIRALFTELGRTPAQDSFYALNYDGEFRTSTGVAAIAGTALAEDKMLERYGEADVTLSREQVLRRALSAWIAGAHEAFRAGSVSEEAREAEDIEEAERALLHDELKTGHIEVGFLERNTQRESRFRLLAPADIAFLNPT